MNLIDVLHSQNNKYEAKTLFSRTISGLDKNEICSHEDAATLWFL